MNVQSGLWDYECIRTNCVPDDCVISTNAALDVNSNMIPDSCEACSGDPNDCNTDGVPYECGLF